MFVSGSTAKHIEPSAQSSRPLTSLPCTVHASPGCLGAGSSGAHLVAFQELPPSLAQGMHFSPWGQSCSQMSHSLGLLASGRTEKPMPVSSELPVSTGLAVSSEVEPSESTPVSLAVLEAPEVPVLGGVASLL